MSLSCGIALTVLILMSVSFSASSGSYYYRYYSCEVPSHVVLFSFILSCLSSKAVGVWNWAFTSI